MKPADLRPGDRIPSNLCGALTIISTFADDDVFTPDLDRVYVDVEPDDKSTRWNPDQLPAATGAEASTFLGLLPPRYRLTFVPDAEVVAERPPTRDLTGQLVALPTVACVDCGAPVARVSQFDGALMVMDAAPVPDGEWVLLRPASKNPAFTVVHIGSLDEPPQHGRYQRHRTH